MAEKKTGTAKKKIKTYKGSKPSPLGAWVGRKLKIKKQ